MIRNLSKRIAHLEHWLGPQQESFVVTRYIGPGTEHYPQPTEEQLAQAQHVVTVEYVVAKDGRPATPEEIAEMYPDYKGDPR